MGLSLMPIIPAESAKLRCYGSKRHESGDNRRAHANTLTVKPPNSDHIGDRTFGLFSEVAPFSGLIYFL